MQSFVLVKTLTYLILPPGLLATGTIAGLLLAALGVRRLGAMVVLLGVFVNCAFAFPPLSDALLFHLEDQARAAALATPRCCFHAIVVLGGGVAPAVPPERDFPSLTGSADRVWLAARLYKNGVAPRIIVSGGGFMAQSNEFATTEAEAMRRFLRDLGVPDEAIIDEGKSDNTIENIFNVRAMVKDRPVALVTSAYHMPRALQIARTAKLDASAFPAEFRALRSTRPTWENWLPTVESTGDTILALHEMLAIAFDWRDGNHGQ